MFTAVQIVLILITGAVAGVITGIMGASGVMVVVPALVLLLGVPVHTAIGTSLLINMVAALVTSRTFYRFGHIRLRPGIWIAIGSVFGAQAGSALADIIPSIGLSNLFGIFLIPMGVLMWRRGIGASRRIEQAPAQNARSAETKRSILIALALGVFVGFMCGIFGAGGGVMILLILIFVLHYPLHFAAGTSSLIMALTAASGAVGYGIRGNMDIYTALIASLPAVVVAGMGARIANRVSEATLGKIIGVIFVGLGISMIVIESLG